METFSALLAICAGNSPVTGEFPAQRSVTRSFDVFFDLRLNKRLSKQSWGWWTETPPRPLWRHSDECVILHANRLNITTVFHRNFLSIMQTVVSIGTQTKLQWRQNEHNGVSNNRRLDCLLNRLFSPRLKKTSKPRVTGLREVNSPVTGEFPAQRASNAENVSIWWRHHERITNVPHWLLSRCMGITLHCIALYRESASPRIMAQRRHQGSLSTLVQVMTSCLIQVMACCLTAPSHNLNQCWQINIEVTQEY